MSFCSFSFGHCVFFSFSIHGFWLPLWYLQTLLRQLCDCQHFLVCCYIVSQMTTNIFRLSFRNTWVRPLFFYSRWGLVVPVVKLYIFTSLVVTISTLKRRSIRLDTLIFGSGFILLLILFACCPSSYSFISMFAVMLVFITSDLEFVPSTWSKYCSFINKNNYRLCWCIQIKCRSIRYRHLNIYADSSSTLTSTAN